MLLAVSKFSATCQMQTFGRSQDECCTPMAQNAAAVEFADRNHLALSFGHSIFAAISASNEQPNSTRSFS
jgi:hypothetical protein